MITRTTCITFDYGGTLSDLYAHPDPELGMRPVTAEAIDTVRALAGQGYRLVLLSNTGPSQDRTRALDRAGVLDVFTALLQSHQTGILKPDPLAYAAVCHAAGCPPEQVMVVGDNYTNDVAGPLAYGMRAAVLRPGGLGPDEHLPYGLHLLRRLTDLPPLLARERQGHRP
ncbi:HAD family hydrolase [Actinomadura litoris]|uniref:HAD-IA family hydrolase n=1 Tax=Actinomadura litoris TaxID=2678616 RepID=A0A7K1LB68_9ACTN|nr:HAD family hydrolase [Actinomadura litoris]MUN41670.1 HAD-IA family hydrolase [Actinomadura litoris]